MSLTIKSLPVEQDLDAARMHAVRGGSLFLNAGVNAITNGAGLSFASPNIIVAPVTQVDASTHTNVNLSSISNLLSNIGGIVGAAQH